MFGNNVFNQLAVGLAQWQWAVKLVQPPLRPS